MRPTWSGRSHRNEARLHEARSFSDRRKGNKMKNWIRFVAVLIVAAGLSGCYERPQEEQRPQTPAEAPAPSTPPETPPGQPPAAPGGAPEQPPPASPGGAPTQPGG